MDEIDSILQIQFVISFAFYVTSAIYCTESRAKERYGEAAFCYLLEDGGTYKISTLFPHTSRIYNINNLIDSDSAITVRIAAKCALNGFYSVVDDIMLSDKELRDLIISNNEDFNATIKCDISAVHLTNVESGTIVIHFKRVKLGILIKQVDLLMPKNTGDNWYRNFMLFKQQIKQ